MHGTHPLPPLDGSVQMSVKNRGFASMSRAKLKEVSSKGGRKANQSPKVHRFDAVEGKRYSQKGVQVRTQLAALKAIRRLIDLGFTLEELKSLNLSDKECIFYGGTTSTPKRRDELRAKLGKKNG